MNYLEYANKIISTLGQLQSSVVDDAIELITHTWLSGNKIICMGNGGSALTAQHYINDWNKAIYNKTGRPFYGVSLVDNIGLLMSYANDDGYENVFIEHLRRILLPDDLVIGISGSGNSANVIYGINYANRIANTLGVCGYDGGGLKEMAKHCVHINVNDMQIFEDISLMFGHMVMKHMCDKYYKEFWRD